MKKILKQLGLYMIRWQCSSPSLAIVSVAVVAWLTASPIQWPTGPQWWGAIAANFVGSLIFFPVDKIIFKK